MNEKKLITSVDVPVEIFVYFLVNNNSEYTVNDLIKIMHEKHKMLLSYNRMNQILNAFTESGRLRKEVRETGRKGKSTAYYTFLKIE